MLSASQTELNVMMNEKTGKLLELRRELEKEMELISKDFISSHCSEQTEVFLDHIKKLKNEYQDEIEEMVDMFSPVLADPEVLDKWTQEVKDIGIFVKKHALRLRNRNEELFPTPRTVSFEERSLELQEKIVDLAKQNVEVIVKQAAQFSRKVLQT